MDSASALQRLFAIASGPRVRKLQTGEVDRQAELGVTMGADESELACARSVVVTTSAAAGIEPPVAAVSTNFRDLPALEVSTRRLSRHGFLGRAVSLD